MLQYLSDLWDILTLHTTRRLRERIKALEEQAVDRDTAIATLLEQVVIISGIKDGSFINPRKKTSPLTSIARPYFKAAPLALKIATDVEKVLEKLDKDELKGRRALQRKQRADQKKRVSR